MTINTKLIRTRVPKLILIYVWLTIISIFTAGPFVWMLSTSFKTREDMFSKIPVLLPTMPTLANYEYVFTKTLAGRFFLNSLLIAGATTILGILLTTLAAYSISRFHFRGRKMLATWLISGQMLPGVVTLIPLFVILTSLGLVNNYLGLIAVNLVGAIPFCTWMLKGYFDTVPIDLEEAAMIDGCSRLQAIRRVFLPVAAPGVAAVALFTFSTAWQEFMFALTLMKDPNLYPLSVGINFFVGIQGTVLWGNIMAMAVLIIVPSLIFFLFLQRYLVSGLTAGAVKT